jgi:hypothetical protein
VILLTWITKHRHPPAQGAVWADGADCLDQARALWATGGCERVCLYDFVSGLRHACSWVWVAPPRGRRSA